MPCVDRNFLHTRLDVVNAERLHPFGRGCVENSPTLNAFPLAAIVIGVLQLQLIRPFNSSVTMQELGTNAPSPNVSNVCAVFS